MSSPSTQPAAADPSKPELPWAFIDCPTDTLIILISHMLNLLIEHNDQVVLTPDALTRFHSRAAPGISVIEYLRRIVKYTNMEKIPLLSLLAYIDLTCAHLPTFTLSTLTVHRFLIAGVCAGSKAQCDVFCTNSHYAKVGGIKVGELNSLEREFLRVTQWNLCCNADLLQRYYTSLIRSHGGYNHAPSPGVIPFRAFPRSLSKPRTADDDDAEEDMPGDTEGEAREEADDAEEDEGMEGDDADGSAEMYGEEAERIRRRRKSVDNVLAVVIEVDQGGQIHQRGRRRKESQEAMEVDPSGTAPLTTAPQGLPSIITPSSQQSSDTALSPTLSTRSRGDAPISPASSSIPSSSRSSFGGSRGRPSLTNLNGSGRPAAAVVDKRHAGSTGLSTPDVLGGTVTGVSPPNAARGDLLPLGAVAENPGAQTEPESYDADHTDNVNTGDNDMDGRSSGRHPQNGSSSTGSHGHSGKILKNIVGAFRKKSSGTTPTPVHEISQPGQRPHQPLPSRPLSTHIAPPTVGDRSSSAMPRYGTTPASPRDPAQMTKSPGMAKNVTPRIRTREERSVDSLRDRNGLGVGVGLE